jgi:23S rRNA pseudouridine1911/1915/1917 synthase
MSDFDAESEAIRNEVPVERLLTGTHRVLRFAVGKNHAQRDAKPWRLDRYLHALMPTISRSMIQRWIERGCATIDAVPGERDSRLKPGQLVELIAPLPERDESDGPLAELQVLYADRWLLVANKPPGQLAHQAGRTMTGTLLNQAQDWFEARSGDPRLARLVNRIDRDTSGIVLISLETQAHVALSAAMEARDLHKEYRAICHGVPEPGTGSWRDPIGDGPDGSIARAVRPDGQACHTDYEVLEACGEPGTAQSFALLRVLLHTGRQHQIRVHAAHHGHPLVGDWVYGRACAELPGQALHAAILEFPHPVEPRTVRVEAPLPPTLAQLWSSLRAGAMVTPQELTAEQRSKLDVADAIDQVRRPSWLSVEDFNRLRHEAGE